MTSVIESHINNVVGHFKANAMHGMWSTRLSRKMAATARNVFFKVLGESYFPLAFKLAAAADPNAKLYYNDCTYLAPSHKPKESQGTLSLTTATP